MVFGNSPADSTLVTVIRVLFYTCEVLTQRAEIGRHLFSASFAYITVFINLQKSQRRCILLDNWEYLSPNSTQKGNCGNCEGLRELKGLILASDTVTLQIPLSGVSSGITPTLFSLAKNLETNLSLTANTNHIGLFQMVMKLNIVWLQCY